MSTDGGFVYKQKRLNYELGLTNDSHENIRERENGIYKMSASVSKNGN